MGARNERQIQRVAAGVVLTLKESIEGVIRQLKVSEGELFTVLRNEDIDLKRSGVEKEALKSIREALDLFLRFETVIRSLEDAERNLVPVLRVEDMETQRGIVDGNAYESITYALYILRVIPIIRPSGRQRT